MKNILVTGATGHLGRGIIEHLTTLLPANRIAALARDKGKAGALAALGVDVREGDYSDPASLLTAMAGMDTVVLVSTTAFSDAIAQHRNVIDAAKKAGVRHILYTGIQRPTVSDFRIPQVSEWELHTEQALAESGLDTTILRNTMYFDALPFMLGDVIAKGAIRAPAGTAAAALAARDDLAEAIAILAAGSGHEGRIYTLSNSVTISMAQVASILSKSSGRSIEYQSCSVGEFAEERSAEGLPAVAAEFMAEWFAAIAAGEFAEVTGELEAILGRKPLTAEAFVPGLFANSAAG